MLQRDLLEGTMDHAVRFLEALPEREVGATATTDELRAALGGPLPEGPSLPQDVIAELAKSVESGLVGSAGGRFFGFVVGGSLPVALAADWLTSAWDQNAGLFVLAPAASVVEEIAGGWLAELLGLAPDSSVGFVTGCQMANFTALAVARHHVLAKAEWDVESDGLAGAPPIRVLAGEERHVTVDRALRFLGMGTANLEVIPCDGEGRMRPEPLRRALQTGGPTIVVAQAGNVNTGAFDPLPEICDAARDAGAWVHVDGAFGAWAAVSPALRHLVDGIERADSLATDAHKWLNVPYDSGLVFTAHPESHRATLTAGAPYLVQKEGRSALDWNPESSRRARGFTVYAALRALGRSGVAELVERCCRHARRFAEILGAEPDVEICNEVVLNQVLVRWLDPDDGDHRTRSVIQRVQEDGTCWLGGSVWQGKQVMRISVSSWATTDADVERSAEAILRAAKS